MSSFVSDQYSTSDSLKDFCIPRSKVNNGLRISSKAIRQHRQQMVQVSHQVQAICLCGFQHGEDDHTGVSPGLGIAEKSILPTDHNRPNCVYHLVVADFDLAIPARSAATETASPSDACTAAHTPFHPSTVIPVQCLDPIPPDARRTGRWRPHPTSSQTAAPLRLPVRRSACLLAHIRVSAGNEVILHPAEVKHGGSTPLQGRRWLPHCSRREEK